MSLTPALRMDVVVACSLFFSRQLFVFCHRCDGPAEGAAFGLPGLRGSYTSHPPQQQVGQPGTHLQAMEVEEKEK